MKAILTSTGSIHDALHSIATAADRRPKEFENVSDSCDFNPKNKIDLRITWISGDHVYGNVSGRAIQIDDDHAEFTLLTDTGPNESKALIQMIMPLVNEVNSSQTAPEEAMILEIESA